MPFDPPPVDEPPAKVDTSSEQYRHECEVRYVEGMEVGARIRLLAEIRQRRGDAAVDRIMADLSKWCLQEITDELAIIEQERKLMEMMR